MHLQGNIFARKEMGMKHSINFAVISSISIQHIYYG